MSRLFQNFGQKIKTAGYAGLFGGVVVAFGGIIYTLYGELSSASGSYALIQRAVERIENDPKLMQNLGPPGPLKVYGRSNRYGRRRPQVISRVVEDGRRCFDTTFWVEGRRGPDAAALVTLQVVEEGTELRERFLAIDFPGEGRHVLVRPEKSKSGGWNPLARLWSWK